MKQVTKVTTPHTETEQTNDEQTVMPVGGLSVRTDLRAGLAGDDLDDKAQELWNSLTNALSNLTGGTDASN